MVGIGKSLKKTWHVLCILATVIACALVILLAGVRIVGLYPYTVLSGSMEPHYHVGSIIYIKDVDPATLSVGDPVTFQLRDGTVVTHRIEEIRSDDGLLFKTKGDANNVSDSPISADSIIGKPVFSIPLLGYVANFIQNPPGTYITIGLCSLFVIIFAAEELLSSCKKQESAADSQNNSDENHV